MGSLRGGVGYDHLVGVFDFNHKNVPQPLMITVEPLVTGRGLFGPRSLRLLLGCQNNFFPMAHHTCRSQNTVHIPLLVP